MLSERDLQEWNIAVCGLNCAKCDIYMASHGNKEVRTKLIEWFKKERNLDIDPVCDGCRGSPERHWSADCKFLVCARRKEVQHCFECGDFPCEKIEAFSSDGHAHHRRTVENMKRMREIGLDAWIAEQKRKGQSVFCP